MNLMTSNTITIPKEMTRGEELLIVPRKKFEEFLRWQKKREWEEKDTDEAIKDFEKAKKEGKLLKIKSLSELR